MAWPLLSSRSFSVNDSPTIRTVFTKCEPASHASLVFSLNTHFNEIALINGIYVKALKRLAFQ